MLGYHDASSALTFLVLLVGAASLPRSTQIPINAPGFDGSHHRGAASPGLAESGAGDRARRGDEMSSLQRGGATTEEGEEEDDDELFKDVDPKTLAAVLLEALNKPQVGRRRKEGGPREGTEEGKAEPAEAAKPEGKGEAARATERANRDRDGRHELELVMAAAAAQGKEEREREEAEERKKKQEEEERMTERVTSRTTSQTVPVKAKQASDPSEEEAGAREGVAQGAPPATHPDTTGDPRQGDEEEEQLSPEEVQNLERMMKKFQSYSAATKRERDSQVGERESRGGFSPYNEIQPAHKEGSVAMSKKKLKWQEETQKAMHVPTFKGGNFMDDFQGNDLDNANGPAQSPPLRENDVMEDDEPEGEEEEGDEEEEEEVLSPAEEEARAKAEQEEVRRQAAEAQRAKMEEEKLADIASDMLLQYMVKQNGGNRRYTPRGGKHSSSHSNAAEDKRSDEEQEAADDDDDDDIDPQTIDKLIEISSKLHLPADDVVDIISDVEKKKKKDVAHEMASPPPRQRPLAPASSSQSPSSPVNGISASQMAAALNSLPSSKHDPLAANPLKAWFLEKQPAKSSSPASEDFWSKPQKPLPTVQDFWLKPQKPYRASYAPYAPYASYYQQKPYRGYYPIYYPPPPKAKPRYYLPKPAFTLDDLLGGSDYDYNFAPKRRFRNWVQARPRKPQASLRRNPYYADYVYSSFPQLRSPPRLAGVPPRRSAFYYRPPAAPVATRGGDYYDAGQRGNQAEVGDDDRLESYIQQILMKRPQMVQ